MLKVNLSGKRILVAGGTGEVGEGIVRRLLAAGAQVVVPARSAEKRDAALERHSAGDEPEVIVTSFSTSDEAFALRDAVLAGGPLDAVVASIGGWWEGASLHTIDPADWTGVMASNLTPHFAVARAFVPVLRERQGSAYVAVLGGAADHPVPHSAPVSVAAAAVKMLGRNLQAELKDGPPAVRLLQIDSPVVTRSRGTAPPEWVTADEVGDLAAELIAGTRAEPIANLKMKTPA